MLKQIARSFTECFNRSQSILLEGALGERLKREYHLTFDRNIMMGSLVYSKEGRKALESLWSQYAQIAFDHNLPFMATTPTRRINKERLKKTSFDESIIKENVDFLRKVREGIKAEMYVGALVGSRGDAYTGENALDLKGSKRFHSWEVKLFAEAGADFIYAGLMPNMEEAAGIAAAASDINIPYIISFTINKNGCLSDGHPISEAIEYIDSMVEHKPLCYMTNCVHPKIAKAAILHPVNDIKILRSRFAGIQPNTSDLSYEELDQTPVLLTADPQELAEQVMELNNYIQLKIYGGCCGTDNRHIQAIADLLL